MITFRAGAATDTGRARAVNQDSLLVVDGRLYAVADGMGGHRGGEVASALALESLAGLAESTTAALVNGITRANDAVYLRSSQDPELRGMGTTLIALALAVDADGQELLAMANVGDSRAYRFRGGRLEQMTEDHSLVESLVRQGRITAEEAVTHPQRNIITRALGVDPEVEVDSWELPAVPGDRYLLCSDGLFNEVEPATIAATLAERVDPDDAAAELVRLANEGGGRDNITCVVVDVLDGPGGADEPVARVDTASEPDLGAYGPATAPTPAVPAADHTPALIGALPDHLPDDEPGGIPTKHRRTRRLTWRVLIFVVALLALAATVVAALVHYGRDTYYVAFDASDRVTIVKGRPGGFLVFDPTVERVTTISLDDLRETAVERVRTQPDQATLEDAEVFVANLCEALRADAEPSECSGTDGTAGNTTGQPAASTRSSSATTTSP